MQIRLGQMIDVRQRYQTNKQIKLIRSKKSEIIRGLFSVFSFTIETFFVHFSWDSHVSDIPAIKYDY